jgi:hypothetical protein
VLAPKSNSLKGIAVAETTARFFDSSEEAMYKLEK